MIKDLFSQKQTLSFEVFPPKKDDEFTNAQNVLHQLSELQPDFISVTYGAGGSRFRADTAADDPGRGAAPDNAPAADQRRGTSAGAAVLLLLGRAGAGDGR